MSMFIIAVTNGALLSGSRHLPTIYPVFSLKCASLPGLRPSSTPPPPPPPPPPPGFNHKSTPLSLTLTLNELTGSWVGPNSTQVPIQLLDAIILVICDIKTLVYDSLYSLRTCAIASVALIFVDTNTDVFSSYDTTHPIVH